MTQNFKLKILALAFLISWTTVLFPALAQTPAKEQARCDGFYSMFTAGGVNGLPKICTAGQAISMVINLLLQFSGLVAVVFLMLGGFWYLTAAGNEEQAEKGRKALTSAVIGLVVIVMAYALVRITVNILTNGIGGGGATTTTTQPGAGTGAAGGTGGAGGAGGAANPGAAGPGAAAGSPLSSDPNNIYSKITQQDVSNNNSDGLATTITPKIAADNSGANFTSTVTGDNKTAIAEMWTQCGGGSPEFEFAINGDTSNFGSGVYTMSGNNEWEAGGTYSGQVKPGDTFSFYICHHQIPKQYVVPQPIR